MFLFLDESEDSAVKVIGGVLVPLDEVSGTEAVLSQKRVDNRLFGEVKWNHITNRYLDKYQDYLSAFFANTSLTYHSCSYTDQRNRYKAAYLVIRAISWKMRNAGINTPYHILFDEGGDWGTRECSIIQNYLRNDPRFDFTQLAFCNQGTSHVMNCLQISDLLTGAVTARINGSTTSGSAKRNFLEYVKESNGDEIGIHIPRFPTLNEYRMHHFDTNSL